MTWKWQEPDWPKFSWNRARREIGEQQFLVGGGILVGPVQHLGAEGSDPLTGEQMSTEAVTTFETGGEILQRASVQSCIGKQLGLATNERLVQPAEQGIADRRLVGARIVDSPLEGPEFRKPAKITRVGSYCCYSQTACAHGNQRDKEWILVR